MARPKKQPEQSGNLPALPERLLPQPLLEAAHALVIGDEASRTAAVDLLHEVAERREEILSYLEAPVKAAHAAWKAAIALRDSQVKPLEKAEEIIKTALRKDREAQQALALRAQREAQEARDREADEIRRKMLAEAADEASRAEIMSTPAEQLTPDFCAPPPFEAEAAEGVTFVKQYKGECTSIVDLANAVVQGRAPEAFLSANLTVINAVVRDQKEAFACPGVQVVITESVRRRT